MNYKASFGATTITTTSLIILLFGSIVVLAYYTSPSDQWLGVLLSSVILTTICVFFFVRRTTGYVIDGNHLTICRPVSNIQIPIHQIKTATNIRKETMADMQKYGANGGFFGYSGEWKTGFGLTRWYATQLNNYLLIETVDNEKIILTPDDRDMVKEIRRLIAR